MPSLDHEGLVQLFRQRPALAVELLREALGGDLPPGELRLEESDLNQLFPTEYRADLVISLGQSWRIIVEIQLRPDRRKHRSWPLYVAALHAKAGCRVLLLVIAATPRVAAWARKPIHLGHPRFQLEPIVIGPHTIAAIEDVEIARRDPERAVLSAFLHGTSVRGAYVAHAALVTLDELGSKRAGLDSDRAGVYADLVVHALSDAQRTVLEELMANGQYEYQTDFARRYVQQGRREGLREGLATGLLAILTSRGLAISEQQRARIVGTTEPETLERWFSRALEVDSVEQLLSR